MAKFSGLVIRNLLLSLFYAKRNLKAALLSKKISTVGVPLSGYANPAGIPFEQLGEVVAKLSFGGTGGTGGTGGSGGFVVSDPIDVSHQQLPSSELVPAGSYLMRAWVTDFWPYDFVAMEAPPTEGSMYLPDDFSQVTLDIDGSKAEVTILNTPFDEPFEFSASGSDSFPNFVAPTNTEGDPKYFMFTSETVSSSGGTTTWRFTRTGDTTDNAITLRLFTGDQYFSCAARRLVTYAKTIELGNSYNLSQYLNTTKNIALNLPIKTEPTTIKLTSMTGGTPGYDVRDPVFTLSSAPTPDNDGVTFNADSTYIIPAGRTRFAFRLSCNNDPAAVFWFITFTEVVEQPNAPDTPTTTDEWISYDYLVGPSGSIYIGGAGWHPSAPSYDMGQQFVWNGKNAVVIDWRNDSIGKYSVLARIG